MDDTDRHLEGLPDQERRRTGYGSRRFHTVHHNAHQRARTTTGLTTLLAERDLANGRPVMPLAVRAQDFTYVSHSLVFPKLAELNKLVAKFAKWLGQ